MERRKIARATLALTLAAVGLTSAPPAEACTALRLPSRGGPLIAKNYDWAFGRATVVANPKGLKKEALGLVPGDTPASWTSRYGSVTFNQYGAEFPNGGMNEAGLVVEALWLSSSAFPEADERPSVNELQWVQYHLDTAASLDEVMDQAPKMRVSRVHGDVHYWVCDRGGACAAFEYIGGKLKVTAGTSLEVPTLTNNPYGQALEHWRRHVAFHADDPPEGVGSLARFTRATMSARGAGDKVEVKEAFGLLDGVTSGPRTQWQIVYAPARGEIHFRTRRTRAVRTIDLDRLKFACSAKARRAIDIDASAEGDVTRKMKPLTGKANADLVAASLKDTVPALAGRLAPVLARYPKSLACVERGR